MLFNSLQFLIFFPIVTAVYFLLPHRFRWPWLLAASCYFYMAFIPAYILILIFLIIVDYTAGRIIARATRWRKLSLIVSLVANLGVLGFFKYYNFLNQTMVQLLGHLGFHAASPFPHLGILLPIGLSFHTFQSMAYTIEVYRGRQPVERHFGIYALYVMFYPQLVAGPIERPQHMLHQFRERHTFDADRVTSGLLLMLWGFIKKVAIADRLGLVVNTVYGKPHNFHGSALLIATIFFTFEIYCDFSGYTDIARGAAEVMGFELTLNFRRPYHARTISDFWRRWHISLSSWFRDYLYIPLGGNRVPAWRWQFNIFVTFLLSGLWHGANLTFLIWGALHGGGMVVSIWTHSLRARIAGALRLAEWVPSAIVQLFQIGVTFCFVSFAWIFFRAGTIQDALYIVAHLGSGYGDLLHRASLRTLVTGLGLQLPDLTVVVLLIAMMEVVHLMQLRGSIRQMLARRPVYVRWAVYYIAVMVLIQLNTSSVPLGLRKFIYFQF